MNTVPANRGRHTLVKDAALTVFQALGSTLVIGAVALGLFAVRTGSFQWTTLKNVAVANRALCAMIFLGVLVWNHWFQRVRTGAAPKGQGK